MTDLTNLNNGSTVAGCCTTGSCGHADGRGEIERLRAAGDALAKWLWRGGGDLADMIAAVAAWEEARK